MRTWFYVPSLGVVQSVGIVSFQLDEFVHVAFGGVQKAAEDGDAVGDPLRERR